jgi:hypothetical protein
MHSPNFFADAVTYGRLPQHVAHHDIVYTFVLGGKGLHDSVFLHVFREYVARTGVFHPQSSFPNNPLDSYVV